MEKAEQIFGPSQYILSSVTSAFITSLRAGMFMASVQGELLEAGLLCPPYKAMCSAHAGWASESSFKRRPETLIFQDFKAVPLCAPAETQTLLLTLLQVLPPSKILDSLKPIEFSIHTGSYFQHCH